jgi:probable selenium-dependent hydroxylase accessory protein YqeC
MDIAKKLGIKNDVVTLVGAGGKTSLMFSIAKELKLKKVLVTTTTKIYYPLDDQYDYYYNYVEFPFKKMKGITVMGNGINDENKIIGLEEEKIKTIREYFDIVLIEGDGSRGLPIKAPEKHEPVIPSSSSIVIGVIGIDSIYKTINQQNVFRLERFCTITGSKIGDILDEYKIAKLIISKEGLFKGAPDDSRKIVVINKVDDEEKKALAKKIFDLVQYEFAISSVKFGIFEKWR